jgi:hypothetical protein
MTNKKLNRLEDIFKECETFMCNIKKLKKENADLKDEIKHHIKSYKIVCEHDAELQDKLSNQKHLSYGEVEKIIIMSNTIEEAITAICNLAIPEYGRKLENSQTCKRCGLRDYTNFNVPKNLWDSITGKEFKNHVLCLPCFDALAYEKNIEYEDKISDVIFIGDKIAIAIQPITKDRIIEVLGNFANTLNSELLNRNVNMQLRRIDIETIANEILNNKPIKEEK